MGKLTYLRPRRENLHPILLLLTSHRLDCFLICLRSLERCTDLDRFKRIYIVANAVSQEHLALAMGFAARHPNSIIVERGPRGLVPAVHAAINEILAAHMDDVIIKLDEDLFVTPGWLDALLEGYLDHADRSDVPLVMPLIPISPPGRHVLNRFLRTAYPSERHMYVGPPVEENWVYHRWMWEKLINENLAEIYCRSPAPKYSYVSYLTINCVVFDKRIMRLALPLPTTRVAGQLLPDETIFNLILHAGRQKVAVLGHCLVHHYSFAACEDYLRSHVPLEKVWRYIRRVPNTPVRGGRCRVPSGSPELKLLRGTG